MLTGEEAERDAKELARAEQDKLGTKFHVPSWTSGLWRETWSPPVLPPSTPERPIAKHVIDDGSVLG